MALPLVPVGKRKASALWIVGNGDCGQMGHGEDELEFERPRKFQFFAAKNVVHLACGGMHTVAVGESGQVWTWGCNDDSALGRDGAEDIPILVSAAEFAKDRIVSASAGDSHTIALSDSGRVWSWGTYKDSSGTLGFTRDVVTAEEPVLLADLPVVSSICSGSNHSMAVTVDKELFT
jgi:regulator of chromosome condensation